MITHDQLHSGTAYSYVHQGADKSGILIGTPIMGKIKMAEFDNGDRVPLLSFMKSGDVILDGNLMDDDMGGDFSDDYTRMMQKEASSLNEEEIHDTHIDDDSPEHLGLSEHDLRSMSEEVNPLERGSRERREPREPRPDEFINIPVRTDENGMPILEVGSEEEFIDAGPIQSHPGGANALGRNTQPAQDPIIALLSKATYEKSVVDAKLEIEMMDPGAFGILAKSFPDSVEAMLDYFVNKVTIHDVRQLLRSHLIKHYNVSEGTIKKE